MENVTSKNSRKAKTALLLQAETVICQEMD